MAAKSTQFGLGAIVSAQDKLSGPMRNMGRAMGLFNNQMGKTQQMTVTVGDTMGVLAGTITKARGVLAGTLSLTQASANLEQRMLEVSKTTGLEGAELRAVSKDMLNLSKRIPVTADGLADIAIAAGQMGISARKDVAEFTRITAQMAAASVFSAEEAGLSLGRIRSVFQLTIPEVEKMGSAMAGLADSFATNEREIAEITQRLGPTAKAAGLTVQETLALSAAMRDMGIGVEVAGTNMGLIIQRMTKDLPKFAAAIGEDAAAFEELFREKPAEALDKFFGAFAGMDKIEVIKKLDELGLSGGRVSKVVLALASNTDNLSKAYRISNDQFSRGTRLQEEAEKQAKGLNAQWTMFMNRVKALGIEIGQVFLPFAKAILGALVTLINIVNLVPKPILAVVVGLGALAAVLAIVVASTGLLALKFQTILPVLQGSVVWTLILAVAKRKLNRQQQRQLAFMNRIWKSMTIANAKAKLSAFWTGVMTVKQWALNAAMAANPIGLVIVAIAALVGGLILFARWVDRAEGVTKLIGVTLLALTGPLGSIMAWIIVLRHLWKKNFFWIQDIVEEFGYRIEQIVKPVREAWDELSTAVGELFSNVQKAFINLVGSPEKFASAVNSAIEFVLKPIRILAKVFTAVFKKIAAGVKWVSNLFADMTEENFEQKIDELVAMIDTLPDRIISFFESLPAMISGELEDSADDGGSAFFKTLKKVLGKLFKALPRIIFALLRVIPTLFAKVGIMIGEALLNELADLGESILDAGKALMESLWKGIQDKWAEVKKMFTDLLDDIRDLLPFSDAKKGPLSNLTKSGEQFVNTVVEGMERAAGIPKAVFSTIFGAVGDVFISGLNSTIGTINSLISTANKIIPGEGIPLIPKISKGGVGAGGGGGPAPSRPGPARRETVATGGAGPINIVVPIVLDGVEIARKVIEITEEDFVRGFNRPLPSARGVL